MTKRLKTFKFFDPEIQSAKGKEGVERECLKNAEQWKWEQTEISNKNMQRIVHKKVKKKST